MRCGQERYGTLILLPFLQVWVSHTLTGTVQHPAERALETGVLAAYWLTAVRTLYELREIENRKEGLGQCGTRSRWR
jgi:hypothetical protein